MDYIFIKNTFSNFTVIPENGIVIDDFNKKFYMILFLETVDKVRDIYKKEINKIAHKDYQLIGVIISESLTSIVEIDVISNNRLLILLKNHKHIINIFHKFSNMKIDKQLIKMKESIEEALNNINKFIYTNIEKEMISMCSVDKEEFYKEIILSDKLNKNKILELYPNYSREISELKKTISDAKKYFRCKK